MPSVTWDNALFVSDKKAEAFRELAIRAQKLQELLESIKEGPPRPAK
jgi:hypothetical protein